MLLAIDTATKTASIALYNEAGVQAECTWISRENHTVELMPQIVRLLELASISRTDLRAIGVAMGPGSFTGLRVGMSIAKGLAFGAQAPLLGIPTLDAIAYAHSFQPLPIWAVLPAGRGRYAVAKYVPKRGVVRRVTNYNLVNAEGMADLVLAGEEQASGRRAARALICGEFEMQVAGLLVDRLGPRALIAPPALGMRRAGFLAALAFARFAAGEADDTSTLAPMYMPFESVNPIAK